MKPLVTTLVRALVVALVTAGLLGQVTHLDALGGRSLGLAATLARPVRPAFLALVAADAVVAAVSGLLALALVFRRDAGLGTRGLAIALAAWTHLLSYSGVVLLLRPDPGPLRLLFEAHYPLVELVGLAGLVHFTARFPDPLAPAGLEDPGSLPPGLRTAQRARLTLLGPRAPWATAVVLVALLLGLQVVLGQPIADAGLNRSMDAVRFAAVGVVVLNVRAAWRQADARARTRLTWVGVGMTLLTGALVLLVCGNILLAATGLREPPIAWRPVLLDVGLLGFLWGLGMGVFYGGGVDGSRALRRTVALTVLVAGALLVATALEVLLSGALVARVALRPGLGALIGVLVVGAASPRLLRLLERWVPTPNQDSGESRSLPAS